MRIEIHDTQWTGSVTEFETAAGYSLSYEGDEQNRYTEILSSAVDFSMKITAENSVAIFSWMQDLLTAGETRFRVRCYDGNDIDYVGFVLNDIVEEDDEFFPKYLNVRTTDGMGRLATKDWRDVDTSDLYEGRDTALTFLLNILDHLGTADLADTTAVLRTKVNWSAKFYDLNDDPLAQTYHPHITYSPTDANGNEKPGTVQQVLLDLCRIYGCRFYFARGVWWFVQIPELDTETISTYAYTTDGTAVTLPNHSTNYEIERSSTSNRLRGVTYRYLPALRRSEVRYSHDTSKNLGLGLAWADNEETEKDIYTEIAVDPEGETTLKVTIRIRYRTIVPAAYVAQNGWTYHRFRWALRVRVGNAFLRRGYSFYNFANFGYDEMAWASAGEFVQVTSATLHPSDNGQWLEHEVSFETPPIPASGSASVQLSLIDVQTNIPDGSGHFVDLPNTAVPASTLWNTTGVTILAQGTTDTLSAPDDGTRVFRYENDNAPNSTVDHVVEIFGGTGPSPVSVSRLTRDADGNVGAGNWEVASTEGQLTIQELLAREILIGQTAPVRLVDGSFIAQHYHADLRLVLDNRAYIPLRVSKNAQAETWTGVWFHIGQASQGGPVTAEGESVEPAGPQLPPPTSGPTTGGPIYTPQGETLPNSTGPTATISTPNTGLQAPNPTGDVIASVSVTTLSDAITGGSHATNLTVAPNPAVFVRAGDSVRVINPFTAQWELVEVTADYVPNSTSIEVDWIPTADYPIGSGILPLPGAPVSTVSSQAWHFLDSNVTSNAIALNVSTHPLPNPTNESETAIHVAMRVQVGGAIRIYKHSEGYDIDYDNHRIVLNFPVFGDTVLITRN